MTSEVENKIAATIIFLSGPLIGQEFHITKPITTLGSLPNNDIVIPSSEISKRHARVMWNGGVWSIEKLDRSSSITIGEQSIKKIDLQDYTVIRLGKESSFRFSSSDSVKPTPKISDPSLPPQSTQISPPAPDNTVLMLETTDDELSIANTPSSGSAPLTAQEMLKSNPSIHEPLQPMSSVSESTSPMHEPFQPPQNLTGGTMPMLEPLNLGHSPAKVPPSVPAAATAIASLTELGIPSLEVTNHTNKAKKKFPLARGVINIGRNAANEIPIDDAVMSERHLQIVRQDGRWTLIYPHPDLEETSNGLLYQGRKIRGKKAFQKTLTQGDVFRIEDEQGNLVTLTYSDGRNASQVTLPPVKPIPLDVDQMTIGRAADNTVVLDHPQVSAHHAQLVVEEEKHRLTDLNSSNHTYVNGIRETTRLLKPDDEIRIGPFRLIYTGTELRQYDESDSIGINALHLQKTGTNGTLLLNDISLSIPPRSFVALVGSSGAGKSTLLDALSGMRPAQQGSVLFNGQDYYDNLAAFRSQLGYVPQDDIIHRDLTVERALYYAAKLRLPTDFTEEQIEQRITEVLEDVEMTRRRTLLIKKLSGGQRKRVSIALELLAKPSMFFLDEPTSGLDPGLDRKMMILLRKLADKGHTVILVTHATNNINVCDAVCFLAQGGRLAYFGPPEEAKTYFGQPDFAEIYNFLEPTDEHPNIPQEAGERFQASSRYQKYVAEPLAKIATYSEPGHKGEQKQIIVRKKSNPWKQFRMLSLRYLELFWNDKSNLFILLLQAPIIGLILFTIVHALNDTQVFVPPINLARTGDAQKFLFIMSFAAIMFGCINAARELSKEEPIYRRERAVNLGILPYLLSKVLILSVLCLFQCIVLLVIMELSAHFYNGIILPEFWEVYITLALSSIAGVLIGLTISALVRNNDQAMSIVPLVLLPQVIFAGIMFPLKGLPLQLFGMLFSLRWALAGLGSSFNLFSFDDKIIGTCASCGTYEHNTRYLLLTWVALLATILILGVLTSIFLKRKDRSR